MFGKFLKKKILLEVSSRSPRTNLQMDLSDVETVLSTSLTEILADNIKSRIDDVLVCNGCLENQANQLGHECVTMDFESRHCLYGDVVSKTCATQVNCNRTRMVCETLRDSPRVCC
ncbi:hypothetical protein AVEN_77186-1 [Araneus ventricosus]|uniref:Uncharacterized protein n=1 Tax=Araneus ventricosus TaxID=182803 RepID=A0A4Y2U612_ARAVE|nr:hypothetical protein AVEN_77186-1 [Araneus ventricosus]